MSTELFSGGGMGTCCSDRHLPSALRTASRPAWGS